MVLAPTNGTLRLAGESAERPARSARRRVGLVLHRTGLYENLTARENLRFYGRLYEIEELDRRIAAALDELGLSQAGDQLVRTLSRGMQQRAALARAILHDPQVLLLDEPETGLDASAQGWLGSLVSRWSELGRSTVITTHRLDWAEQVADRALMLRSGTLQPELPVGPGLRTSYMQALGELP
jgi:heme exporter protein A